MGPRRTIGVDAAGVFAPGVAAGVEGPDESVPVERLCSSKGGEQGAEQSGQPLGVHHAFLHCHAQLLCPTGKCALHLFRISALKQP